MPPKVCLYVKLLFQEKPPNLALGVNTINIWRCKGGTMAETWYLLSPDDVKPLREDVKPMADIRRSTSNPLVLLRFVAIIHMLECEKWAVVMSISPPNKYLTSRDLLTASWVALLTTLMSTGLSLDADGVSTIHIEEVGVGERVGRRVWRYAHGDDDITHIAIGGVDFAMDHVVSFGKVRSNQRRT
eukprot:CAMPEP_0167829830 /NCGR_PEP_ID=MMETSP0112_2-20121227/12476_1 /TAXON_ID=91324 /ORGANISM="Lotharella globosa, Strain CCCM811" /LENGTH=185 /DNA_ID=CAMNT_0007733765 /DNA_START=115 /DNA_END=671 /DNA_ORIENTATION=+